MLNVTEVSKRNLWYNAYEKKIFSCSEYQLGWNSKTGRPGPCSWLWRPGKFQVGAQTAQTELIKID